MPSKENLKVLFLWVVTMGYPMALRLVLRRTKTQKYKGVIFEQSESVWA